MARGRPSRSPPRRRDPGEPRQPARRRQGGEAPALRQPALRQRPRRRLRRRLPGGPPLPPRHDRLDGGPRRREPGRRARLLPRPLRPGQHRAHPVRRPHRAGGVRPRRALLRRAAGPVRAPPPEPGPARPPGGPGAGRPPRGRAQRPPARRVPPARRRDRRVPGHGRGPGLHRWPRDLTAGAPAGPSRADRARGARHGLGLRRRRLARLRRARRGTGHRPRPGRGGLRRGARGLPARRPDGDRARGLARAVGALVALGAGQPGGARRPDQPPPPAPRRPRRRQHPPRPAPRRHRRAGRAGRPAVAATGQPSRGRLPRRRHGADSDSDSDTTEDVA